MKLGEIEEFKSVASAPFRLFAVCGDFVLAYTLFFFLQSYSMYENSAASFIGFTKEQPFMHLMSESTLETLFNILFIYLIYFLLRFFSTLLFGVSLNQFLIGLRGGKSFYINRLGGISRVLIELILGPLLVFDVASVWKGKTFKEVITGTVVVQKSRIYSYVILVVLIPIFVTMSFMAPFVHELSLLDDVKVSGDKYVKKLNNYVNFKNFRNFSSNYFKFQAFSSLHGDRFLLIPGLDMIKRDKYSRIFPKIYIYDLELKSYGELKKVSDISLLDIIPLGMKGNPLFRKKYPELFKLIKKDKLTNYQLKPYNPKYLAKTLLSSKVKLEILDLFRSSFELSFENLYHHLTNNGPFIRGYILIRSKILKLLRPGPAPDISFVTIGNQQFISFNQSFNLKGKGRKNELETLIPTGTNNSMILEYSFDNSPEALGSWRLFKKSFWGSVDWYFDYYSVFPFSIKEKELDPMLIIDHFSKGGLSKENREKFEENVYHFYFDLAKKSLELKDQALKDLLIDVILRLKDVARLKNNKNENYYSFRFLSVLEGIVSSLKRDDLRYFDSDKVK